MTVDSNEVSHSVISGRRFLQIGLGTAAPLMVPGMAWARLHVKGSGRVKKEVERTLSFYNLHTGEKLKSVYWHKGEYVPGAIEEINYILRDSHQNEVKPINPELLELLVVRSKRLQHTH